MATHAEMTVAYVATNGQYGFSAGSFFNALIRFLLEALPRADRTNRVKLQQAWPEYVAAVDNFHQGGDLLDRVQS